MASCHRLLWSCQAVQLYLLKLKASCHILLWSSQVVQLYLLKLKASKLPVVAVIQACGVALPPQIEGRQAAPDCCCPAKWCSLISSNWRLASCLVTDCCDLAKRCSLISSNWRHTSCYRLLWSSQAVQPYLVESLHAFIWGGKAAPLGRITAICHHAACIPSFWGGKAAPLGRITAICYQAACLPSIWGGKAAPLGRITAICHQAACLPSIWGGKAAPLGWITAICGSLPAFNLRR